MGDAVLELVITEIIFTKGFNVGKMSKLRSIVVRNVSLVCLMNDKGLCNLNLTVNKSCADSFEAIIGAVYTHLKQYNIDDVIKHPEEQNLCEAIQRQYDDILAFEPPNLGYITNFYERLNKYYEYYKLGKVQTSQFFDKRINMWIVKIVCPLTIGCQYYIDKNQTYTFIGVGQDRNQQAAREKASKQAIDMLLNDYKLQ